MSLIKKSFFTSMVKLLNILLNFIAQLILTPMILHGLGPQQFGIYSIINKIQNYLSLADLRPSAILRYKLAVLQKSDSIKEKREYIGAAVIISLLIMPLIMFLGYIFSEMAPQFFKIDHQYVEITKYSILLISFFIAIKSLLSIPEAIIRGNNLEYKTFYVMPIKIIVYSILIYIFLYKYKKLGLLGVILAIVLAYLFEVVLMYIIQRKYLPEYVAKFPAIDKVKEFFRNGSWYMGSSFFSQILNSFDVILIGALFNMKLVTVYVLSRAILVRIAESISIVLTGITSSIGELISSRRFDDLKKVKLLLFRLNIILSTFVASYFIIFNKSFITLWVGEENYIGDIVNLIFCLSVYLILAVLTNEIFINSFQYFKYKTYVIFYSSLIAIVISLTGVWFGIVSVALGYLGGKLFQFIKYEILLKKKLSYKIREILFINFKIFLFLFFSLIFYIYKYQYVNVNFIEFIIHSVIFIIIYIVFILLFVITSEERTLVYNRFKSFIKR